MTVADNGGARSVVITGASTGIGEACALRLDRAGFRVFAGVRRDADAQALRAKASARLTPVTLDVTDAATIAQTLALVTDAVGPGGLSGLVNNAGVSGSAPLEYIPLQDLRAVLEVNLVGQLAMTQAFLPLLRARRGRIVMVGSVLGLVALPVGGAYVASKFGLEGLTDVLRLELTPAGVAVSIVEPGAIATPIWTKGIAAAETMLEDLPASARPAFEERYGTMIAAAREGARRSAEKGLDPDDVARVIETALTAARPAARYQVGRDAKLMRWLRHIPARRLDRMRLRWYGHRP